MNEYPATNQLVCPKCRHQQRLDSHAMAALLGKIGMLRRSTENDPDVIFALFESAMPRIPCPECGEKGLILAPSDARDDWDSSRPCATCGRDIPPERLEIFPNETLCAACKESGASASKDQIEYCPTCGAVMTLRQKRGAGLARYVMVCSECGRSS